MTHIMTFGALLWLLVATTPLSAHHSFPAQYDSNKPTSVQGLVTKVEWTNPHVYFYLDVTREDGKVESWAFEMGSPIVLQRRGWSRHTLKVGDIVEVDGALARDGSNLVNAATVRWTQTGESLSAASLVR